MASLITRTNGQHQVKWRLGGARTGAWQSPSSESLKLAEEAKQLAEAHKHDITRDKVYAIIRRREEKRAGVVAPGRGRGLRGSARATGSRTGGTSTRRRP